MIDRLERALRRWASRLPPGLEQALRRGRRSSVLKAGVRASRRVRWGTLRRFEPVDAVAGENRGTPLDVHFLARFVETHADAVRGRVLEIRDARFSRGRPGVEHFDVLDVDPTNENATMVADLGEKGALATEVFDCIIVGDALRAVSDLDAALRNAWQCLEPGGVLLVSIPAVAPVRPNAHGPDRRRLLPAELEQSLMRCCQGADISVVAFGNLVVSIAFLAGLAAEDLRRGELEHDDERYPVIVCGRAAKTSDR